MRIFSVSSHERPPTLTTAPDCTPAKGEILVRNLACGLNFADLLMMRGKYQDTPALPFTLGMEVAGVVETLGPDTDGPAPGTRVAVFGGSGGLADYGVYPADRIVPLPDEVDMDTAAAFAVLDDGVFQLAPAQQAAHVQQKDLTANLQALPMFGVDSLFVAKRSLDERGLDESALPLPMEVLDDAGLNALINRYDHVITL